MTTRRKRVKIQHGDQVARVDEDLAPLILEIWQAGIHTIGARRCKFCCCICVCFRDALHAEAFLDIVGQFDTDPDSLYQRILAMRGGDQSKCGLWSYGMILYDLSLFNDRNEKEDPDMPSMFNFFVDIEFPASDLPEILKRLEAHNAAAGLPRPALSRTRQAKKATRNRIGTYVGRSRSSPIVACPDS
jgi:hypothetical protein